MLQRSKEQVFVRILGFAIAKGRASIHSTQPRYIMNLESHLHPTRQFSVWEFVFLEVLKTQKRSKLEFARAVLFPVLSKNNNTVTVQRGEVVKTVTRERATLESHQSRPEPSRETGAWAPHFSEIQRTGRTSSIASSQVEKITMESCTWDSSGIETRRPHGHLTLASQRKQ